MSRNGAVASYQSFVHQHTLRFDAAIMAAYHTRHKEHMERTFAYPTEKLLIFDEAYTHEPMVDLSPTQHTAVCFNNAL